MRVRTLGGLALEGTTFTRPKPLTLLAYLAIEGVQERRHVAGLFWPRARDRLGSLTVALSQLRRGAPGSVHADRTQVWTPVPCDAAEFLDAPQEAPDAVVELGARGPFLAGVSPELLGVELEEWVFRTREFLALRLHRAHLRRAEALAAQGRWRAAALQVEAALPLLDLAPEPEDLMRLHTLLLAAGHDRAKRVRDEAEGLGLDLATTRADARRQFDRARLATPRGTRPRPLPRPAGALLGRSAEVAHVGALIREPRAIVALTGPPGVGKTRLALEIAHDLARASDFGAGVAFVSCPPLRSASAIPHAVAEAFGVAVGPRDDPGVRLAAALDGRAAVLVCDAPEHLLANAEQLERLSAACPGLRVLLATRVRPPLDGAKIVPLAGLAFPADDAEPGEVARADAVRTLVREAQRVRPSWQPSDDDLRHVLAICRAVEGLPLGLELAAAWIRALPLEEIAPAINEDVDLLSAGACDASGERRSVTTALERSWRILAPAEQRALRRLAVLPGPFGRASASAVAGATITTLARLVDASLLRCDETGRFDRHPLVAAFARRKLVERPHEGREARRALAHHALDLVAGAGAGRTGRPTALADAFAALEEERQLLWAAFEGVDPAVREDDVVEAIETLASMFEHRARAAEGVAFVGAWLDRWCAADEPRRSCAHALVALARLRRVGGELAAAQRSGRQALRLATALADPRAASAAHQVLGVLALHRGDHPRAHEHMAAAVRWAADEHDPGRRGVAYANLALASQLDGRREEAIRGYRDASNAFQDAGDVLREARTATNLGLALFDQGRLHEARRVWESGLALAKRTGNRRDARSITGNLGMLHAALGDLDAADDFDAHALRAARADGDARSVAAALVRRAQVARRRDDAAAAAALAREAIDVAWRSDETASVLDALKVLADAWAHEGHGARALGLYRYVRDHPATPAAVRAQACTACDAREAEATARAKLPFADASNLDALVARIVG